MLKKIAIGLAVVAVLLVIAVVAIPQIIDWNRFRPQIAEAVKEATGRDLTIGNISIDIFPDISFQVADVRFANAEGASPGDMLTLQSLSGRIALWPLLGGRVHVFALDAVKPVVHLAVDSAGRPNWVFPGAVKEAREEERSEPGDAAEALANLQLDRILLQDGQFTYADARTGQRVEAKQIELNLNQGESSAPLTVKGSLGLNGEPVQIDGGVNTPAMLLAGEPAAVNLAVTSKHLKIGYDGTLRQAPEPGAAGSFEMTVPSVAALARWLDRPLAAGQPDPGPLSVKAKFKAEGARATLETAQIEGQALKAQAQGSVDASGKTLKAGFTLTAGVLDIDRYLPPPAETAVQKPTAGAAPVEVGPRDLFAGIPDEAFDLTAFRGSEAKIKVDVDGIRARGLHVGKVAVDGNLAGGLLNANVSVEALYGGGAVVAVKLDGTRAALQADISADVDKVDVGAFSRATQGADAPVAGIATVKLRAKGAGKSPRALARGLVGSVNVVLAGGKPQAGQVPLTAANLTIDLPGGENRPTVEGQVTYNGQPIQITATTEPLETVFAKDRFQAELIVRGPMLALDYTGAVQARPAPGLDGRFVFDAPSVGRLRAWLDAPLPAGQPDPGPLKAQAVLRADGLKMSLEEAVIEGKALQAKATASFDRGGEVPALKAQIDVTRADLDAYLPKQDKAAAGKPGAVAAPAQGPTGWSREPIDVAALRQLDADVGIRIGSLRYKGLDLGDGQITAVLKGGALAVRVTDLKAAGGTLSVDAGLDGSTAVPALRYDVKVAGVQARPLLSTFADFDRLSGTADVQASGTGAGGSERAIVESLDGKGQMVFRDGAIHGFNLAAVLRQAKSLSLGDAGEEKTDFAELSGSYTITRGVVSNQDLKLLAPLLRVNGAGTVPLPPRTIDYRAEAKLVGTLQGQGGDEALAGLPVPVVIRGSWEQPKFEIDWKSVLLEAAKDPARLKAMPDNLKKLGQGLGVDLPLGDLLKKNGNKADAAGELLKLLPGLTGQKPATEGSGDAAPQQQPAPNPLGDLQKLFKK